MNTATIIIGLLVLALIISVCYYLISLKKKGKSTCASGCAGCPLSGRCNQATRPKSE